VNRHDNSVEGVERTTYAIDGHLRSTLRFTSLSDWYTQPNFEAQCLLLHTRRDGIQQSSLDNVEHDRLIAAPRQWTVCPSVRPDAA